MSPEVKNRVSVAPQKGLMSSKNLFEKSILLMNTTYLGLILSKTSWFETFCIDQRTEKHHRTAFCFLSYSTNKSWTFSNCIYIKIQFYDVFKKTVSWVTFGLMNLITFYFCALSDRPPIYMACAYLTTIWINLTHLQHFHLFYWMYS